jgi:hypothetical protein
MLFLTPEFLRLLGLILVGSDLADAAEGQLGRRSSYARMKYMKPFFFKNDEGV